MAYDENNRVPLFYEKYDGSINDVAQFTCMVDKVIDYGYRKVGFILDREYFSKENIQISEDTLTTAFCAASDLRTKRERSSFSWPTVIGHNNFYLQKLLQQELSDNHFHLWASSPHFCLSWINMMNHTDNPEIFQKLKELNENRLYVNRIYDCSYEENPYEIQYLQAALIRLFLFAKICGQRIRLCEYELCASGQRRNLVEAGIDPTCERILRRLKQGSRRCGWGKLFQKNQKRLFSEEQEQDQRVSAKIGLFLEKMETIGYPDQGKEKDLCCWDWLERVLESGCCIPLAVIEPVMRPECYRQLWENCTEATVESWLRNEPELLMHKEEIQLAVNSLKWDLKLDEGEDYAFGEISQFPYGEEESEVRKQLGGERFFLYQMYRKAYCKAADDTKLLNWFYAYLVIKESLRSELIQSNERLGFRNFQNYDRRKTLFLSDIKSERQILKMAIDDTLSNPWLRSLEIRIVPRESTRENMKYIQLIDGAYADKDKIREKRRKERYYFVFHFVKSADADMDMDDSYTCRHYLKRQQVKKQAVSIAELRELCPEEGSRVLGIDACSGEIGCRPEVFAQAFRFLKNHSVENTDREFGGEKISKMPRLRITYHVGEDFLDIVDGLRAIDEAIHFLNLSCGDRLGHALAMGVDVREYYARKHNIICLSRQDYLDNLAWMYHRLGKSHIKTNMDDLRDFIENEFNTNFGELYGDLAQEHNYNIRTYYEAWQLRGDNPECYRTGLYVEPYSNLTAFWEQNFYDGYEVNYEYPKEMKKRKVRAVARLYWAYHFNPEIRRKGSERREFRVPDCWVKGAEYLQKTMQQKVAKRGISIECNPSSNSMIAGLNSYQEHPITRWYNNHLEENQNLLKECPQLSVSINTDDKGDFSTSIENEYALMACTLEQARKEDGSPRYKRTMIYEWLDEVRRMGNLQSFQERKKEAVFLPNRDVEKCRKKNANIYLT